MLTANRHIRSTCPYCGVGCQVTLQVKDEGIFRMICAVQLRRIETPAGDDPVTQEPLTSRGAIKDQAKLVQ